MATYYEAFTPTVIANQLMMNRKRDCVFKNICYTGPFLGDIKNVGDVLHIPAASDPVVDTYVPNSDITLRSGGSYKQDLPIDQLKYVNEQLDKVENKQAAGEIFNKRMTRAKQLLAQTMDEYIAGFYEDVDSSMTLENTACKSTNVLSTFADAEQMLLEADVPFSAPKFLVISPAIYTKFVLGKIQFENPNKEEFGAGFKGSYLGFKVFVSNSIQKTGNVNHCLAMSEEGIALAEQILPGTCKVYEPEKRFASAFKALHVYGATIMRAKELVRLDITAAAETTI